VSADFTDRLGSVVDIQNWASGALVDHISYTGNGVRTDSNAGVGDGYGYTGAWSDSNTGLQLNGRRWYDPKQGRWISEDPIGFAGGLSNLYGYVANDPTNGTDPSGLAAAADEVVPSDPAEAMNKFRSDPRAFRQFLLRITASKRALGVPEVNSLMVIYAKANSPKVRIAGTVDAIDIMLRQPQNRASVIAFLAKPPGEYPPLGAKERALIASLGDDDFGKREKATNDIKAMGKAALPLLAKAEESSDAEIRNRATSLLAALKTSFKVTDEEETMLQLIEGWAEYPGARRDIAVAILKEVVKSNSSFKIHGRAKKLLAEASKPDSK
jgi:RHS repeat-associated protein